MSKYYFDYNATCPASDAAITAWVSACRAAEGNPSSLHWAGRKARKILDDARDRIAHVLRVEAGSVVFTSGGTEANNMAIHGTLSRQAPGNIVCSAIEHPSVLQPMNSWGDKEGWSLKTVRPCANGALDADTCCAQIDADTRMVAVMLANNETGVIQPVERIVQYCRALGVPVLVDAVQVLGKMPLNLQDLGADFVSVSGHKVGSPKGVGALITRRGVTLDAWMQGGGQERKRRAGTENVPGVAGFAAALTSFDVSSCKDVRDRFEAVLLDAIPDVTVYGADAMRLQNTSMFSVPGMDGETLLMQLDLAGFAVASGSACSSGKREPSHVLLAMGVSQSEARGSLRVSFGPESTWDGAQTLVQSLQDVRQRMQRLSGRS